MDHEEFARRDAGYPGAAVPDGVFVPGHVRPTPWRRWTRRVYQALRALRQLRQPAFFETWLTRILLNACHRELRRRRRLAGEEALPESAGPDAYDALPLREAVRAPAGGIAGRW